MERRQPTHIHGTGEDTHIHILEDGRKLGFADFGDPDGQPIFFFSEAGTRLGRPPHDDLTDGLGARLITVDRPGIGLSSPIDDFTLLDWSDDIAELAVALGINRFAVIGVSFGGPYAAACGYALPDRVTDVALINSFAPLDAPGMQETLSGTTRVYAKFAQWTPALLRPIVAGLRTVVLRDPSFVVQQMALQASPPDQRILEEIAVRRVLINELSEVYRQGAAGYVRELTVHASPWGFAPAQIHMHTYLWQGEQDPTVPAEMGRYLAGEIPDCDATFLPDQGHYLVFPHWKEILVTILG